MWFESDKPQPDWEAGMKHLSKVDPVLRGIIKKVGPCTLKRRRDYFVVLCQSIFSQQISVTVAATLFKRFRNQFPRQRPTPVRVIEVSVPQTTFADLMEPVEAVRYQAYWERQAAFQDLQTFRSEVGGIPAKGGSIPDGGTLARIDSCGNSFYGMSAHGQPMLIGNGFTCTHAELGSASIYGWQTWAHSYDLCGQRPLHLLPARFAKDINGSRHAGTHHP